MRDSEIAYCDVRHRNIRFASHFCSVYEDVARYERGATLLTTNRPYKQWAGTFNNDATLTSALLNRLLDHVDSVVIEGKSYRGQANAQS